MSTGHEWRYLAAGGFEAHEPGTVITEEEAMSARKRADAERERAAAAAHAERAAAAAAKYAAYGMWCDAQTRIDQPVTLTYDEWVQMERDLAEGPNDMIELDNLAYTIDGGMWDLSLDETGRFPVSADHWMGRVARVRDTEGHVVARYIAPDGGDDLYAVMAEALSNHPGHSVHADVPSTDHPGLHRGIVVVEVPAGVFNIITNDQAGRVLARCRRRSYRGDWKIEVL